MLSLKNPTVSDIVCPCLVTVHLKAFLVVGLNKSDKKPQTKEDDAT